jgi:hypothetical protein
MKLILWCLFQLGISIAMAFDGQGAWHTAGTILTPLAIINLFLIVWEKL